MIGRDRMRDILHQHRFAGAGRVPYPKPDSSAGARFFCNQSRYSCAALSANIRWSTCSNSPRPIDRQSILDQSILPMIFVISAAEKARSVSVRTLPSAPRLKFSDINADSSGASTMVTMS